MSGDCEAADAEPLVAPAEDFGYVSRHKPVAKFAGVGTVVGLVVALSSWHWTRRPVDPTSELARKVDLMKEKFDCHAGLSNWYRGWSEMKKEWCCSYEQLGCSGYPVDYSGEKPFACDVGLHNWETGWSMPKKRWCCGEQGLGCAHLREVTVTFLVADVNYLAIRDTKFIIADLMDTVKQVFADTVNGGTMPDDVATKYWAGSGIHACNNDDLNTGMVVRVALDASNTIPQNDPWRSHLEEAIQNVQGIGSVTFCPPTVHDTEVLMPIDAHSCTCEHGIAATQPTCTVKGGNVCGTCEVGFHLTKLGDHRELHCLENQCTCPGGIASKGPLCESHLSQSCASCLPGHHYDNEAKSCKPNVCTCPMGYQATGKECTMHLGEVCGSCYKGYHVDPVTKQCEVSACHCPNGVAVSADECHEHGTTRCVSCSAGFHLSSRGGECLQNKCTCEGGTPAIGEVCPKHGASKCAFCDSGFFLHEDGMCGDRRCRCPNGTATEGDACRTDHGIHCSSCDRGFTLHATGQCMANRCGCENGLALPRSACDDPGHLGKSICASCFHGYHLVDRECAPNTCACEHGEPSLGAQCPEDNSYACNRCHEGYRLELTAIEVRGETQLQARCVPNICTCRYGDQERGEPAHATSTPRCKHDGANSCVGCRPHYHLEGDQCVANQCRCHGGYPAPSEQCSEHGRTNCTECHTGYWMATDDSIELKDDAEYPHKSFEDGTKVCMASAGTTSKPYDCIAAYNNWEQAWSDSKKHWCCTQERRGCIAAGDGYQNCEGHGYGLQACSLVGCCKFDLDSMECKSAVQGDICLPEFRIKAHNGLCLGIYEAGESVKRASLQHCDSSKRNQFWSPNAQLQIASPENLCLEARDDFVIAKTCEEGQDAQKFSYIDGHIMHKQLCLTAQGQGSEKESLDFGACAADRVNQHFAVPMAKDVASQ